MRLHTRVSAHVPSQVTGRREGLSARLSNFTDHNLGLICPEAGLSPATTSALRWARPSILSRVWGQDPYNTGAPYPLCGQGVILDPQQVLGSCVRSTVGAYEPTGNLRDNSAPPYNTSGGRDCVKSLRLFLHGTCPPREGARILVSDTLPLPWEATSMYAWEGRRYT